MLTKVRCEKQFSKYPKHRQLFVPKKHKIQQRVEKIFTKIQQWLEPSSTYITTMIFQIMHDQGKYMCKNVHEDSSKTWEQIFEIEKHNILQQRTHYFAWLLTSQVFHSSHDLSRLLLSLIHLFQLCISSYFSSKTLHTSMNH